MTEALPALRPADPQLDRLARLGTWLAASEAGGNDPQTLGMQAALRLYLAAELGLPPLAASELSLIKGRLVVGAKLLRALAARHGYRVVPSERTPESCTAVLLDHATGQELGRYTFTIDDARKAGLVRPNGAWQTHPARMLWARASKFVLDDYAPEVTLGLVTADEAQEMLVSPPAHVDWSPVDENLADEYEDDIPFGEPADAPEENKTP